MELGRVKRAMFFFRALDVNKEKSKEVKVFRGHRERKAWMEKNFLKV